MEAPCQLDEYGFDDTLVSSVPESLLGKLSSFKGPLQESDDEYDYLEIPESFWEESEREDKYDRIETPEISDADYDRILRLSNQEIGRPITPATQSSTDYDNLFPDLISDAWPEEESQTTTPGPVASIQPSGTNFKAEKRKADEIIDCVSELERPPKRAQNLESKTSRFYEPVIIAHSPLHQSMFQKRKLSYGVQWEIARLVTSDTRAKDETNPFSFDDIVISMLDDLRGTNADNAPKTASHLLQHCSRLSDDAWIEKAFASEMAAKSPWEELDLEEAHFPSNPLIGLGDGTRDKPDWYAGKVIFRAQLKEQKDPASPYRIVLDKSELGPSCRFSRRFGSNSFLRIKIPILKKGGQDVEKILEFLCRPFVLLGRVFRLFYAKDATAFMVVTNEVFNDSVVTSPPWEPGDYGPMPLWEFLNWFNPLEHNQGQSMSKYVSRFALGLSNSVPGVRVLPSDLLELPDIVSTSGSDMTDGCGYTTRSVLLTLRKKYDWDEFPTSIQCRISGTKGLLLMHPDHGENLEDRPRIWLRPSQIKIRYPPPLDPAMLWIDLLRHSHMRVPGRLAVETIICLAENKVPHEIFAGLLRDGLQSLVADLTIFEGHDAMFKLWYNVAKHKSVIATRVAREAHGEARVRGFGEQKEEDPDGDTDVEDGDDVDDFSNPLLQRSSAWWTDQISGCPSSLEETVMVLLDAGFKPQTCAVLKEKLKKVVESCIDTYVSRYKLEVSMSCMGLLVPDPYGILEPDEVQIKCSRRKLLTVDGYDTDCIQGEVLLMRHPCKLPSDIRKLKAVVKPELYQYQDVIVCSTQGERRAADYLAGGDYDGDKACAFWDPRLVEPFVNADLKYSEEPKNLAGNFSKVNEKVSDFLRRVDGEPTNVRDREVQKYLVGALRNTSHVGIYNDCHINAMYQFGYDHDTTIEMAYMFCKVLDGAKLGLTVIPEVFKKHCLEFNRHGPAWKDTLKRSQKKAGTHSFNTSYLGRGRGLPVFVMDTLRDCARKEKDNVAILVHERFQPGKGIQDADLIAPWLEAQELAQRESKEEKSTRRSADLDKIAAHVAEVYESWRGRAKKAVSLTDLRINARQDVLRRLSKKFASISASQELLYSSAEITRLAASYAYLFDSQHAKSGWSRFPWDVALRELCHIKAQALGPWKTVNGGFYDRFQIKPTFFKH